MTDKPEEIRQGYSISETELFWLAGILEGEGSFMMINSSSSGRVYRYPKIVVSMTDRDIIERVANLFGTAVYNMPVPKGRETWKSQFRAQISGSGALSLTSQIQPIMGRRRSLRIDEILAEAETIKQKKELQND